MCADDRESSNSAAKLQELVNTYSARVAVHKIEIQNFDFGGGCRNPPGEVLGSVGVRVYKSLAVQHQL